MELSGLFFPLSRTGALFAGMALGAAACAAADGAKKLGALNAGKAALVLCLLGLANGWFSGFGAGGKLEWVLSGISAQPLARGLAFFAGAIGCAAAGLALAMMGRRGSRETAASLAVSGFLAFWIVKVAFAGSDESGFEEWICLRLLECNAILVAVGASKLKACGGWIARSWAKEAWLGLSAGWLMLLPSWLAAEAAGLAWEALRLDEAFCGLAFAGRMDRAHCGFGAYAGSALRWETVAGGSLEIAAITLGAMACSIRLAKRAPAAVREAAWAAFGVLGVCSVFAGWVRGEQVHLLARALGEATKAQACAGGVLEAWLDCAAAGSSLEWLWPALLALALSWGCAALWGKKRLA